MMDKQSLLSDRSFRERFKNPKVPLGMVAYPSNPSTQGGIGQPNLQSKFQGSQATQRNPFYKNKFRVLKKENIGSGNHLEENKEKLDLPEFSLRTS